MVLGKLTNGSVRDDKTLTRIWTWVGGRPRLLQSRKPRSKWSLYMWILKGEGELFYRLGVEVSIPVPVTRWREPHYVSKTSRDQIHHWGPQESNGKGHTMKTRSLFDTVFIDLTVTRTERYWPHLGCRILTLLPSEDGESEWVDIKVETLYIHSPYSLRPSEMESPSMTLETDSRLSSSSVHQNRREWRSPQR